MPSLTVVLLIVMLVWLLLRSVIGDCYCCKRNLVSAKDSIKILWDSVLVCGKMGKTDVGRIIIFVGSSRRQQEI